MLGFTWLGQYFFDVRASFGGRHSAYVWEYVSALLKWILVNHIRVGRMARWVDDFIGVSEANEATECYLRARAACSALGVPVHKLEPPSHSLSYCGVLFDTQSMTMSVPSPKRDALLQLLVSWLSRTKCTKHEMQSLVGKLNHIAMVVRPGRAFIGRMLDVLRKHDKLRSHHHITISSSLQRDIRWWHRILGSWSGTIMLVDQPWLLAHTHVMTVDASQWGRGVVCGATWYSMPWSNSIRALADREQRESMPYLELYTIAEALHTYGASMQGQRVVIYSDCQPCVDRIKERTQS